MAKEKQTEDQDQDDTEAKAAEIGKKVGVEEKDDDAPEYDIIEDKGETIVEQKKDDEDEGDERLGKRPDPVEKKHLTNREKRHIRKERLRKKIDAKDQLIRQQQEQINNLGGQIAQVNGRLANFDQAQFTTAWNESVAAFQRAEQDHQAAFAAADGAKATQAMRDMYVAQKRIDQLEEIKNRQSFQQPAQQQAPQDTLVRTKAAEWASRNTWFKPGQGDDDSAIADTIAAKIAKEGYDPKTDDYWDELDERLAAKGIGEAEEDEEPRQTQPKRRSPPVGGGSGRGDLANGKVQVSLPTAYIENLKQAGMWDSIPIRNKMIKKYLEGIRNRERGD
jgi:hypothetical protein